MKVEPKFLSFCIFFQTQTHYIQFNLPFPSMTIRVAPLVLPRLGLIEFTLGAAWTQTAVRIPMIMHCMKCQ